MLQNQEISWQHADRASYNCHAELISASKYNFNEILKGRLESKQVYDDNFMNILAIDFGTKNIGLARASIEVDAVLPFGKIDNAEKKLGTQKLAALIKKEKIDKLVVGLPLGLDGSENKNTARVKEFVDELKKEIGVPVEFITEIFSSQAGDRMGGGASRDEKAAMVILRDYLDKLKNHK